MATAIPFMNVRNLRLTVASGDDLDVRHFRVREALSELFDAEILAVCRNPDVDLGAVSGRPARFDVGRDRSWSGICAEAEQIEVEEDGVSTYRLRLVPQLWLLGHRRSYRVFQQVSELEIVLDVLARWGIVPRLDLSPGDYKPRRYRVQYGETDLAFVHRMLEDAGIAYFFGEGSNGTELVLSDRPNEASPSGVPIPFVSKPNDRIDYDFVTRVATAHRVRPGKFVQADVDWRRPPEVPIQAVASLGAGVESQLELYHLDYGSFLFRANDGGGGTPNADDRGPQRTDDAEGGKVARKRLDAARNDARAVTFETNAHHVRPGQVILFRNHPRADLAEPLLVARATFEGQVNETWSHQVEARAASADFRPPILTPRPKATGVESATVVGPPGEEIHTDEFGRVRVQFHWDREGGRDDKASCWVPVSQSWGGSSFGGVLLPRVGQEVLVDFLGGDPDRPVVMGRVFTKTQPVPYELPKFKSLSGFRTESYPRPKPGGGGGGSPRAFRMPLEEGGVDGMPQVPLPGNFAGQQVLQDIFAERLAQTQSKGADETAHARSANEIMCRDDAGQEQLHIQAQRDFACNVKRNCSGSIGANRVMNVCGNDAETVECFQSIKVGQDRTVGVDGKQVHTVKGMIKQESVDASQYLFAKEDIVTACKVNRINGSEMNVLFCGDSTIVMRPGFIILQSPYVFLNPGQAAVDAAIESGTRPQTAEELAAQEQRAAERAQAEQVQRAQTEMAMRTAGNQYGAPAGENVQNLLDGTMSEQDYLSGYEKAMRDAAAGMDPQPPSYMVDDLVQENLPDFSE